MTTNKAPVTRRWCETHRDPPSVLASAPPCVGNDIIDLLALGQAHPRFAQRVMSPDEFQRYKARGEDPSFLWRCWAAKEAAYKLAKQKDPRTQFSPCTFVLDSAELSVGHEGHHYPVYFVEEPRFMFAHCAEGAAELTHCITRLQGNEHSESKAVRSVAAAALSQIFGLRPELIIFASDQYRIPRAHGPEGALPCALSFSHHGIFVAASIGVAADASNGGPGYRVT